MPSKTIVLNDAERIKFNLCKSKALFEYPTIKPTDAAVLGIIMEKYTGDKNGNRRSKYRNSTKKAGGPRTL